MIVESIPAIFSALKVGFDFWGEQKALSAEERKKKIAAINTVMEAVQATRAYLFDKEFRHEISRVVERDLSHAWQKAGAAIREYDEHLYNSSYVKSLGWGDPRRWEEWRAKAKTIDLDLIEKQCEWLRDNET